MWRVRLDKRAMMYLRIPLSGWGCWLADRLPVFPVTSPPKSAVTPANDKSTKFIASAARSAELCAAHLRAKHLGTQQGQTNRNSGQRAGSRSCTRTLSWRGVEGHTVGGLRGPARKPRYGTHCRRPSGSCPKKPLDCFYQGTTASGYRTPPPRNIPFHPLRPGPKCRGRKASILRFRLAGKRQVILTAQGIGVREHDIQVAINVGGGPR
jgi:hypothetical protein